MLHTKHGCLIQRLAIIVMRYCREGQTVLPAVYTSWFPGKQTERQVEHLAHEHARAHMTKPNPGAARTFNKFPFCILTTWGNVVAENIKITEPWRKFLPQCYTVINAVLCCFLSRSKKNILFSLNYAYIHTHPPRTNCSPSCFGVRKCYETITWINPRKTRNWEKQMLITLFRI